MTWVPLLLSDPSPTLRMLVLRDLLHRSDDDPEIQELETQRDLDPIVVDLLKLQLSDGSWERVETRDNAPGGSLQATSQALTRLGYLGFGPEHPAVKRGAEFIFSLQRPDGAWTQPKAYSKTEEYWGYEMMPLQTAIPLRGLAF